MSEPKAVVRVAFYRKKSVLILSALLLALIVLGSTTQTWLHVAVDQAAVKAADIAIQGSKAATAVTAFAVVALAGSLAVSISGRVMRVIAAGVVLLAAIGIDLAIIAVVINPQAAASGPVGAEIGLTGISLTVSLSAMIWVALAAGALLILSALAMLILGQGWSATKKYHTTHNHKGKRGNRANKVSTASAEQVQSAQPVDDIESWDRLSRGEDPTSGTIEDSSAHQSTQEKL